MKFLQIWVFPNKRNVTPRCDQITLKDIDRHNKFQQILSPDADDAGVWIYQEAWFHLGQFDENVSTNYTTKKKGDGVYAFVIAGDATIDGKSVNENQAVAGSLLGLASQKLSSQDYQKVASVVPGSAHLVKKAGVLTGLGSNFGSFANVTTALGKLGLAPVQVTKMAGSLTDFVGKEGGDATKNLLLQVLK